MYWRTTKLVIDLALTAILALATYLIFSINVRGYIKVPEWIAAPLLEHFIEEYDVEYDELRYYPKVGMQIENISLTSETCICPLVRFGEIELRFVAKDSWDSEFETAFVGDGVLYFPDPYLPEATNLKLVENLQFSVKKIGERFALDGFEANLSKIKLISNDPIFVPETAPVPEESHQETDTSIISNAMVDRFRELSIIHRFFSESKDATVIFSLLEGEESGDYNGYFDAYWEGSRWLDQIVVGDSYLYGSFILGDAFSFTDSLYGAVNRIDLVNGISGERLHFRFDYDGELADSFFPANVDFHLSSANWTDKKLDFLAGSCDPNDLEGGFSNLSFGLFGEGLRLKAIGTGNLRDQISVEAFGYFDALQLIRSGWFGGVEVPEGMDLGNNCWIRVSTNLVPGSVPKGISFSAQVSNLLFKGVEFETIYARGVFDDLTVRIDPFYAGMEEYLIGGSVFKDLKSTAFHYQLLGSAYPEDFNPMFRPWWSSIWENLKLVGPPVRADIDIWGVENDSAQRNSFGSMNFDAASYKGLEMEGGRLNLHSIAKYTRLFDMVIQHAEGEAVGQVKNIYEADGVRQVSQGLELRTDIPVHHLGPVLEGAIDNYLEKTEDGARPQVAVNGTLVKKEFQDFKKYERLEIQLDSPDSVEFMGVEFDRVSATVVKQDKNLVLMPFEFGFAGGEGMAEILIQESEKGESSAEFEFDLREFSYREAVEKFKKDAPEDLTEEVVLDQPKKDQPKDLERKAAGKMNLTISGETILGKWETLSGEGNMSITDPLIHRVHIFGGISKVLDNAELNLGSFSLKEASSPILVEGKKVHLTDLTFTGPSSSVKSKGTVDFETNTLDFRMKAFPLGEVKFPLVAGLALLMRPITGLFEVRLTGPIDDPESNLVLDPSGL